MSLYDKQNSVDDRSIFCNDCRVLLCDRTELYYHVADGECEWV